MLDRGEPDQYAAGRDRCDDDKDDGGAAAEREEAADTALDPQRQHDAGDEADEAGQDRDRHGKVTGRALEAGNAEHARQHAAEGEAQNGADRRP